MVSSHASGSLVAWFGVIRVSQAALLSTAAGFAVAVMGAWRRWWWGRS